MAIDAEVERIMTPLLKASREGRDRTKVDISKHRPSCRSVPDDRSPCSRAWSTRYLKCRYWPDDRAVWITLPSVSKASSVSDPFICGTL